MKFLDAALINGVGEDESQFTSLTGKKSLRLYAANTSMALGLNTIPGSAFWMACEWISAGTRAKNEIIGVEAVPKSASEARAIGLQAEQYMAAAMQLPREKQIAHLVETTTMFEVFTMRCGPYAHGVLENVLKSMVVGAWTCLEALSETLYYESHTETPASFPALSKTQEDKIGFRSRKKIRDSFRVSFLGGTEICSALDDKSLDALALLRNVIVHKAAIADQEFMDGIPLSAPYLDAYKNLTPDRDAVALDGAIVYSVVDSAFKCGHKCIAAVDRWIVLNRKP